MNACQSLRTRPLDYDHGPGCCSTLRSLESQRRRRVDARSSARRQVSRCRQQHHRGRNADRVSAAQSIKHVADKIVEHKAVVEKQRRTHQEVMAVAGQLRQVFSNILANRLDALGDNGIIKVRVSTFSSLSGRQKPPVSLIVA